MQSRLKSAQSAHEATVTGLVRLVGVPVGDVVCLRIVMSLGSGVSGRLVARHLGFVAGDLLLMRPHGSFVFGDGLERPIQNVSGFAVIVGPCGVVPFPSGVILPVLFVLSGGGHDG